MAVPLSFGTSLDAGDDAIREIFGGRGGAHYLNPMVFGEIGALEEEDELTEIGKE